MRIELRWGGKCREGRLDDEEGGDWLKGDRMRKKLEF